MVSPQKYNLQRALDGILDGTFRSARHAAKAIGDIHHSTIARNLKRRTGTSGGHNKALNSEQEIALKSYCDRCITLGSYAKYKHIRLAANSILRYAGSSKKVSRDWVTRFIRKTPKYRFKKSRSIGAARRAAAEKAEIVEHFRRFEAVCNEKKIKKQNIWNFDETGFRIGCLGSQLVLIWAEQKQVYLADPENREYVTCMESVSADGRTIDPMIIFQGAHYLEKHFDNDLNDDVLFAQSESGYTNDYLSYRWLMHWERLTRPQNPEENRLLIMDGHGSHLTFEFINYCDAHKVFPFLLPPHSTHLLQPLDIGIFQQYKHYHQELLDDEIRIGGLQFNKEDFFRVLQRTRNLAFKKRTITFAFRQAGLVPCDPGVVLDKMNEFSHPERPCTPPPREINWKECVTPTGNIAEVQRYSKYLETRLLDHLMEDKPITPSITRTLYKRDKASMALMLDGKLAVKELHDKMAKETAKKARMSGTRVVQAYGVIYAGDARLRIMQRNKDDIEKEEAAMEARLKIYENRFKRIVKSFKSKRNRGLQERSEREVYKKRYRLVMLELRRKL